MTRAQAVQRFTTGVSALDLRPLPLRLGGRYPLYYRLADDLVVMLILESSRGRSTASWWLGVSFAWGYVPDGVSGAAYRRVATLLTVEERRQIIGPEPVAEGFDHWWPGGTEAAVDAMVRAASVSQGRFLEEAPAKQLRRSKHYRDHRALLADIWREAAAPRPARSELADANVIGPFVRAATMVSSRRGLPAKAAPALGEDAAAAAATGLIAV